MEQRHCSSWCCHLKCCDVHVSICSVLFPATVISSAISSPLPDQTSGACTDDSPSQEPTEGENHYFSPEPISQPRLLEGPTAHVMCSGVKWLCCVRQVRLSRVSKLVLFCHLCTQFFTGISDQMNKGKGIKTCTWMCQFKIKWIVEPT